jgi:hypothetical protein
VNQLFGKASAAHLVAIYGPPVVRTLCHIIASYFGLAWQHGFDDPDLCIVIVIRVSWLKCAGIGVFKAYEK